MQALHHSLSHIEQQVPTTNITRTYTHIQWWYTRHWYIFCACAYDCVCNRESSSLSTQVFRSIAVSDVTSMSIVKQCYLLDSILGTQCTNEVLNNPGLPLRDLKRRVLEADRLKIIDKSENSSLSNLRPPLTMGTTEPNFVNGSPEITLSHCFQGLTMPYARLCAHCP